jgi:hypothetical protein
MINPYFKPPGLRKGVEQIPNEKIDTFPAISNHEPRYPYRIG